MTKTQSKFEDYKKQCEREKRGMQEAFDLELFKANEEIEKLRHENDTLKKKIAQV